MESIRDFYCDCALNGETPIQKIREMNSVLAFYHTKPSYTMHIVIIPKQHISKLEELINFSIMKEIFEVATDIIRELHLTETNYKIITNGGSYQDSQHLHFHLISGNSITHSVN